MQTIRVVNTEFSKNWGPLWGVISGHAMSWATVPGNLQPNLCFVTCLGDDPDETLLNRGLHLKILSKHHGWIDR